MTRDTRWRIGDVVVDGLISGAPSWPVGGSETIEVYVGEESTAGRPTDEPVLDANAEAGLPATYGDPLPACFGTPAFETATESRHREDVYLDPADSPYGALRELAHYSGSATTELSVDGVPLIREVIPARADLDSFVFDVVPIGDDLAWASGAWVLVTGASDTSEIADVNAFLTVELECAVLAPLEEYRTREELKADMAPPVVPE